jgi:large subunit ribosomal protein L6
VSRIGKTPVPIPKGIKIHLEGTLVTVEGPKGKLTQNIHPQIKIEITDKEVLVQRPADTKYYKALHGLYRALIANMITGVTQGFVRNLEIIGVGYRAEKIGKSVNFYLGYSHPVAILPPAEVTIQIDGGNKVAVSGINKQAVGQVAAEIRALRPPEPYKGKGIRYVEEYVRKKAGKTAGA